MRQLTLASLLIASTTVAAGAQGAGALDAVARAMGGKDRIVAVRTLVLEGTGDNFNLGQNLTPSADLPRFEVTQYRRSYDFTNKRWFLDQTRVPRFITGNTAPQRQRLGNDGDVAYNVGNNDAMNRVGGQAALDRAFDLLHHPIGFLQGAWAPGSEVFPEETPRGGQRLIRITWNGNKFALFVDPVTSLPAKVQKMSYNANLGDVLLETEFADWRDVDGLKLPMRITQKVAERWVTADIRLTSARVNADVGDLAASPAARAQPVPVPAAPTVTVEEIAPGVWYLNGGSHHSVAIEQQRSVVLVEAPQSEERTLAVIDKARTLVPGKPVDVVINTHHHFDHSTGIRAAISQGLTVLTHEGNRDLYERTFFPGKHFVVSDAQTRNPKPLRLMPLGDKYVRRDSLRTIETYHLSGNTHSGTMLVVYLPAERLLIQADLYAPPAANATAPVVYPFAANLLEHIQRRGLQVDRVVGIHGRAVPLSEVQAAVRAP
jgi:glyoxylase-like metal-dependent hydrolase (beta-lactamase superfamily II)